MFSLMHFSPVCCFKRHFLMLYFRFYGFVSEWHLKAMILALYLTITLESKDFNTTQTWVGMILKYAICFSADICFLWAVDTRNKKKRKMEIWIDLGNFLKLPKPLPLCFILPGQSLQH